MKLGICPTKRKGLKMENIELEAERGHPLDVFKGAAVGLVVSAAFWVGAYFFVVKFL